MERAITFLEKRELPPHWDRDILNSHEEESTNNSTTASSESEELEDDDEEDESPEDKDHLVAELYKHMEDRGSPIDKTPSIEGKDVDLYKLYRIVDKLGGNVRVNNKSLWRQVANKLGFFSNWGINQVRVHYNRYLRSFEDLNRTLGCTMVNHPRTSSMTAMGGGSRNRQISGSTRVQMRGTSSRKSSKKDAKNLDTTEEKILPIPLTPLTPMSPPLQPIVTPGLTSPITSPEPATSSIEVANSKPVKEEPAKEVPIVVKDEKPIPETAPIATSTPAREKPLPVKDKATPLARERSTPAKDRSTPTRDRSTPVKDRSLPVKERSVPMKEKSLPVKDKATPMKGKTTPAKEKPIAIKAEVKPEVKAEEVDKEEATPLSAKRGTSAKKAALASRKEQQKEQVEQARKKQMEEMKMTTRPRRDSSGTTSLAAAMQVKAQKDEPTSAAISRSNSSTSGGSAKKFQDAKKLALEAVALPLPLVRVDRNKETEIEAKKIIIANSPPKQVAPPAATAPAPSLPSSSPTSSIASSTGAASSTSIAKASSSHPDDNSSSDETKRFKSRERGPSGQRSRVSGTSFANTNPPGPPPGPRRKDDAPGGADSKGSGKEDDEDFQHLEPHVHVAAGDKIRVFYKFDNIYEAKVKRVQARENSKWPRYFVHYQGWNARYDEWIKRSKIRENLSWSKDRVLPEVEPVPKDEPMEAEHISIPIPDPVVEAKLPERKKPGPKTSAVGGSKITPLKKPCDEKTDNPQASVETPKPTVTSSGPIKDNSRAGTPSSVTSKGSRTGSPALKRQSSRSSSKKETDSDLKQESDSEEEEDSEEPNSRKSSRITREKVTLAPTVATATPSSPSTTVTSTSGDTQRRGGRKRVMKTPIPAEESETEDVEIEKDDAKQDSTSTASTEEVVPSKPKRGRKPTRPPPAVVEDSGSEMEQSKPEASTRASRSTPTREKQKPSTPTRGGGKVGTGVPRGGNRSSGRSGGRFNLSNTVVDDEEDPYAFKEPEVVVENVKSEKAAPIPTTPTPASSSGKKAKSEERSISGPEDGGSSKPAKMIKVESSDSTDSSSSDVELTKKAPISTAAGTRSSGRSSRKAGGPIIMTSSEDDIEKSNNSTGTDDNDQDTKEAVSVATGDMVAKSEMEVASTPAVAVPAEVKPLHQFTKKQQEMFPNLASKIASSSSSTASSTAITKLTSSNNSGTTTVNAPPAEAVSEDSSTTTIPVKSDISGSAKQSSTSESASSEPEITRTKHDKRKTPMKPKSDELIDSETESDSSSEMINTEKGGQKSSTSPRKILVSKSASTAAGEKPKKSRRKLLVGTEAIVTAAASATVDEDEPLIRSTVSRRSENKATSASLSNASSRKPSKATVASVKNAAATSSAGGGSSGIVDEPSGQGDDLDLVCGETIPGSPVHPSSTSATGSTGTSPDEKVKTSNNVDKSSNGSNARSSNGTIMTHGGQQTSTRLEMPFASVPESVEAGPVSSNAGSTASDMPATLPPASETPETTANSTPSRLSPIGALANAAAAMQALAAGSNDDGSKSPGGGSNSSEVDMDSLKAESVDIEGTDESGEAKQQRGGKRKAPSSEVGSRSPAPASRRKRRARESGHRGGRGGSRGRHGSGVRGLTNNDDTDESEEAKDAALSVIGSLDNDALAALAQQSPKSTKFNFYPDFGKLFF